MSLQSERQFRLQRLFGATALLENEGYESSDECVEPDDSYTFNSQTESNKFVARTPINVVPPM